MATRDGCQQVLEIAGFMTWVATWTATRPRLPEMFRREELVPLGSRVRVRMTHEYATREELRGCLVHRLTQAGNATLATPQLLDTLSEHAAGNYRVLLTMAAELLDAAIAKCWQASRSAVIR